ncbi:heat stress transcription factor A-9-like [Phragmites australis]|uniref:heat stress transcription factor A-9-like n=1 Tax=Phragmites australis TaxID=29695 RepID=UPI002D784275|nr:heat stress transcription factor A-9-like [Phragmites australis]XP_062210421.1 heat stress transcription factor A-9-like [Phragmites australis]XP_062210423.1 heat stress transcription factor A-9-like [Phragmites australis]
MGSKKRSPQHPAAGEEPGDVGAPPAGKGSAASPAPAGVVPRPADVAPFLTKVYDMVSDPATDAVISWGAGGGSFVIWDSHAFERDLLPRHFKHNHFTSFIRQLNTYGFHKVDPDRWEWANEGFVKDQKHLLKTIKRKKKSSQDAPSDLQQVPVKTAPGTENIEIGKYGGLEKEVETLKRDKALLMQQLVDLRQYQQSSSLEVQSLIQRLRVMEQNQQQMMALLAIVVQNPNFLNQLVQQQQRRSNWWNDDGNRKRRFHALEQGPVADQETSDGGTQIIQYCPVPETSNQVISVNGAFCSTPAQAVSSPALAMPMDIETTSNNVDTLSSAGDLFSDTSALHELDDMDLFGMDLEYILQQPGQAGQMETQHNCQVDPPLTIQDYGLEQDCQMEALQDCTNPQYADVITEA